MKEVIFGHFTQSGSHAPPEPLSWLVLENLENKLLLLSKYALYEMSFDGYSWASSKIRRWLNNEFLSSAFSEDEQQFISPVTLFERDLPCCHPTEKKGSSIDQIFLLSRGDVEKHFPIPESRITSRTPYARSKLDDMRDDEISVWWLRNARIESYDGATRQYVNRAICVLDGQIYDYGMESEDIASVRPALIVNLPCPYLC